MKNLLIITYFVLLFLRPALAESLSYSGRLVHANGSPVTGLVDLKFELAYSGSPTPSLCSKTINGVSLTNGVFHVNLDFENSDCTPTKALVDVLNDVPASEEVVLQVTDLSNSKTYPHQALSSVPFSMIAKTISSMGATVGQVLKWDGSKWAPATDGGGSGSVTEIQTGSGLSGGPITSSGTITIATGGVTTSHIADNTISNADINVGAGIARTKLASGVANQVVINDGSGVLSSAAQLPLTLGGTGAANVNDARANLGLGNSATRDVGLNTGNVLQADEVPSCLNHQKIQKTALAPYIFSCVADNDSADASKLPLLGGTMLGGINMSGFAITNLVDPTSPQDAVTKKYVDDRSAQWGTVASGIQYASGNVGIGVVNPSASLDLAGSLKLNIGTPGLGKVLTSDANGNATWLDPVAAIGTAPIFQVRVATTTNITLSGLQTIDGISLNAGDRVLVRIQSTAAQNGIYIVGSGSWTRATEMNEWREISAGIVQVQEGNNWQGMTFKFSSFPAGTIGSSSIMFSSYGFTTGFNPNLGFGKWSLHNNTTGLDNVAIGYNALFYNTSGSDNVAIGANALMNGTTLHSSVAIGKDSLKSLSLGLFNVGVGTSTLSLTTTGRSSTALGNRALANNTTADYNTAVGSQSLLSTSTGRFNTAVGGNSMQYNQTGENNVAIGMSSFMYNKVLSETTVVGFMSMTHANDTTTPGISYNTAVGAYTLYGSTTPANNTGTKNTALGHSALRAMTSGSGNIGVGHNAGSQITTGSNNIIIGSNTGSTIATSSNNILIADGVGTERVLINSAGFLGIGTSNPLEKLHVAGNILSSGTISPSDKRLKKNFESIENSLEKINTLHAVTYDWKAPDKHGKTRQMGVIAQEVEKVFPEAVTKMNDGFLAVSYTSLISPLIAAVQELYRKFLSIDEILAKHVQDQGRQMVSIQEEYANLKAQNSELKEENSMIKAYLCQKDPLAPFCSNKN